MCAYELAIGRERPTDSEAVALMRAVQRGERAALERLYYAYFEELRRILTWLTPRPAQVAELVDEIFLAVWNRAGEFHFDSSVSTWLLTLAYPIVIKEAGQESLGAGPSCGLAGLPIEEKTAVLLTFVLLRSREEIAHIMGSSAETVIYRLQTALPVLRANPPRAISSFESRVSGVLFPLLTR